MLMSIIRLSNAARYLFMYLPLLSHQKGNITSIFTSIYVWRKFIQPLFSYLCYSDKNADSREIAMDIVHSEKIIDLCRDEEIEPSQHASKLHSKKPSSVSLASIDSLQRTTRFIDLYQDDDIYDGNLQLASGQQKGACENTISGTNKSMGVLVTMVRCRIITS
jgi:hypothetical protein